MHLKSFTAYMSSCTDEDREEIQAETHKQEEAFDQIGAALGDLKHMSHVSRVNFPASYSATTNILLCAVTHAC